MECYATHLEGAVILFSLQHFIALALLASPRYEQTPNQGLILPTKKSEKFLEFGSDFWILEIVIPSVVYFDQILGAACTQKHVQLLFFSRFQPFLFFSY